MQELPSLHSSGFGSSTPTDLDDAAWRHAPVPLLVATLDGHSVDANPALLHELRCAGVPPERLLAAQAQLADSARTVIDGDPTADGGAALRDVSVDTPAGPWRAQVRWGSAGIVEHGLPCRIGVVREAPPAPALADANWLLDNLHEGVLFYDAQMRIYGANLSAQRLLDTPLERMLNHTADELGWRQTDEEGQPLPRHRRPVWHATQGEERLAVPISVDTGHGPRWLLINARPVNALPGLEGPGAVASFVDVTRLVGTLRDLHAQQQRLALYAQHTDDVLWMLDPTGRELLFLSPAFERVWGLPVGDLRQSMQLWLQGLHPEDRERVREVYRHGVETRGYSMEYRVVRPDGSQAWVRERAFLIHVDQQGTVQLAGVAEDVTAAHTADAERQRRDDAERVMRRIVATAPGALFSYRMGVDGSVQVDVANPQVLQAYARASGGTSVDIRDVVHPGDRRQLREARDRSAREMTPWRHEFRVQHPSRGERWAELHAMPVHDDDGGTSWHGFLHDITRRKRMEEEIRAANAELESRVAERTAELEARHREMEAFTYSVSHDLKAPLRGIDGYGRLLEADKLAQMDEEARGFVTAIRGATAHMAQLIDDLLAYSRMERSRPRIVDLQPADVVRAALAERHDLSVPGLEVTVDLQDGEARADRDALLVVVRNLMDNALKFSAGSLLQRVAVRCVLTEVNCEITVSDNGAGFDMRYHDRIFEIFQRLHRAEEFPGTGVGLALVRKGMERMGGRVWAHSVPGQGTTFHVAWPRAGEYPPRKT